ncbi:MAG: 2OG-Fe(II) oxygenase [Alphaproteobacteria bacterium]|nr:2OG-Fe(II) oxygenase [Alphaproteobacteria bacterium]
MALPLGAFLPWFAVPASNAARFAIDTVGGRIVLLTLLGRAEAPDTEALGRAFLEVEAPFAGERIIWFGLVTGAPDAQPDWVRQRIPGRRFLFDTDGSLARELAGAGIEAPQARPATLLLDRLLRLRGLVRHAEPALHASDSVRGARALLAEAERLDAGQAAPVLTLTDVFERSFCERLIATYEAGQPEESGFMTEEGGRTVGRYDHGFKSRHDLLIADEGLRAEVRARISARLVPAVHRAFAFKADYIERYLVACYDAEAGGRFRAHRDNTTAGTAHRRFAVTINLNAEDYEGGDLSFPEFGPRRYRAPTGGAVVFSCSLLHEVDPVRRGRRFCCLPFLYDAAARDIRERNIGLVGQSPADPPPAT